MIAYLEGNIIDVKKDSCTVLVHCASLPVARTHRGFIERILRTTIAIGISVFHPCMVPIASVGGGRGAMASVGLTASIH